LILIAGEFDPEFLLLAVGFSFIDFDSGQGNNLGLSILFLGVVKLFFFALKRKETLHHFLGRESLAVLLEYVTTRGFELFLFLFLGRFFSLLLLLRFGSRFGSSRFGSSSNNLLLGGRRRS
jgi:hypothetical protein